MTNYVDPPWSEYDGPPTPMRELTAFSPYLGYDVCWPNPCNLYRLRHATMPGVLGDDPASVLVCRECGCAYQPVHPSEARVPR